MLFGGMRLFLQLFAEKLTKTTKRDGSSKSCKFWPNRRFLLLSGEMRHFLELFAENLTKTPKRDSLLEELQVLAKSTIFGSFWRNEALSASFR